LAELLRILKKSVSLVSHKRVGAGVFESVHQITVICGGPYVDYSVMIIIGEIVSYLVLKPFFSVWQALAGILQPTHVPSLLRAKKVATVFLVAGVFGMSAGVATLLLWGALRTCLLVLLAGFISLAIASAIGHRIEQEVMQEPRK
jgi:hypothetical protein